MDTRILWVIQIPETGKEERGETERKKERKKGNNYSLKKTICKQKHHCFPVVSLRLENLENGRAFFSQGILSDLNFRQFSFLFSVIFN